MSHAGRGSNQPRAMIHRRILDAAESDPDASLEALAEAVSGASPDLVDRVLREYGDPGNEPNEDGTDPEPDPESTDNDMNAHSDDTQTVADGSTTEEHAAASADDASEPPADGEAAGLDLSEKQRRTLRALYERPEASQGDLAEQLDVTRATVSRRLNAIPGFEWADRRAFAESVFGGGADAESDSAPANQASTDGGPAAEAADGSAGADGDALDAVESALADLEDRVAAVESRVEGDEKGLSPELAHKVAHACMESDRLTEDEELAVLRAFME